MCVYDGSVQTILERQSYIFPSPIHALVFTLWWSGFALSGKRHYGIVFVAEGERVCNFLLLPFGESKTF